MERRTTSRLLVAAVLAVLATGCEAPGPEQGCHPGGTPFDPASAPAVCFGEGTPLFEDVTAESGAGHVHRIPEDLDYYHANIGGGAVMEDLDGDGDLDLYVSSGQGPKALYWNRGDGTFDECAERAGVRFPEDWTNGVSAADYDNDGDQDLYLLNHGKNRLLQNQGDGTFTDVTDLSGTGDTGVGASASWADVDGDGHLDLFVANLARSFHPQKGPENAPSVLYRNRGDGTFEDASGTFGPGGPPPGASYLGMLADLDGDRVTDLLLTEEFGTAGPGNRLYRGVRSGGVTWELAGPEAGVAHPAAVMGGAVLDDDRDGRPDLYLTNLWGEPPNREALLRNRGDLVFEDVTVEKAAFAMTADVSSPGLANRTVSWGVTTLDADNDGREDLYVVYGHMVPAPDFNLNGSAYPPMRTGQQNALFLGGESGFQLAAGTCAEEAGAGRGVAAGDVDGDGCEDLYVVNERSAARLLRNRCPSGAHHIELSLVGTRTNRDAVGARVTVTAGGVSQVKWLVAGTSVHSAPPKRLHFGLGAAGVVDRVLIEWPDGTTQELTDLPADRRVEILQP